MIEAAENGGLGKWGSRRQMPARGTPRCFNRRRDDPRIIHILTASAADRRLAAGESNIIFGVQCGGATWNPRGTMSELFGRWGIFKYGELHSPRGRTGSAMNRGIVNTVCAIIGAISLLGIVGGLLKLLGYPALAGLLAIARVPGIDINWDGVWLVVFIASAIGAIAVNLGPLREWREGREAARGRNWNMNFCDAVTYLSYTSLFGTAWPEPDKTKASAGALYEAARKGTVDIAGQYKGSSTLTKIPRHWFNGLTAFDLAHCAPHGMKNAFLLDTDKKTPAYSSLMVDRGQIQRAWPPKPIAYR